ncbi:hypothetical protein I3842_16G001900 [Carya illinoinensis]|uniref:Uncharacterized protein n=1 Tax=Carya illinoinensis TaxID=32201 RepID=A0A922D4I1_CARIL|nr:hypothetical protein I3842_16G001900 [Carya illinoinensis]
MLELLQLIGLNAVSSHVAFFAFEGREREREREMEPDRRKKTEKSKRTAINNEEEKKVEELLQAAQDELLLKLSLDSHMSRVPPDYLHTDLDRRFQSLKSRPSLPIYPSQSQKSTSSVASAGAEDEELKAVLGDELSARFAALKGSLFSSSSSSSSTNVISVGPISSSDDDEEDEVEKLIRWAKDAARLDPSPPSDEDDEEEDDNREHEKLYLTGEFIKVGNSSRWFGQ